MGASTGVNRSKCPGSTVNSSERPKSSESCINSASEDGKTISGHSESNRFVPFYRYRDMSKKLGYRLIAYRSQVKEKIPGPILSLGICMRFWNGVVWLPTRRFGREKRRLTPASFLRQQWNCLRNIVDNRLLSKFCEEVDEPRGSEIAQNVLYQISLPIRMCLCICSCTFE